ncbi:hypothetical protein EUX98_g6354 [Antrodiella citrinella]|uniref:Uncharacterized protein n=1 Tax=Antrodiella citrinella TaxID=2447956 RepID=A0A4V3XI48_9APHY|nr:hypothetical protein EUX98_g6354 [Antrodiella citrinella]
MVQRLADGFGKYASTIKMSLVGIIGMNDFVDLSHHSVETLELDVHSYDNWAHYNVEKAHSIANTLDTVSLN